MRLHQDVGNSNGGRFPHAACGSITPDSAGPTVHSLRWGVLCDALSEVHSAFGAVYDSTLYSFAHRA